MTSQQNLEQHTSISSEEHSKADPDLETLIPTYIDVVATMPNSEEKELFKNVRAFRNAKGRLMLSSVCEYLKESGINVAETTISYYSPVEEMYIFAGKEPINDNNEGISIENLSNNRLLLKFRAQDGTPKNGGSGTQESAQAPPPMDYQYDGMNPLVDQTPNEMNDGFMFHQVIAPTQVPHQMPYNTTMSAGDGSKKDSEQDLNQMEELSSSKDRKRTKERNISFVIEKVSMWRKLYNGIQDNQGKIIRYSLEDAAKQVNISKKSLDDYLLQLRYGKKYGFDFNEHKDDKIGVLRAFVKKKKTAEKVAK